MIPFYVVGEDSDKVGKLRRSCTREFKIEPINRAIREILGLKPRQHWPKTPVVDHWFGISYDEIRRMRDSDNKWAINTYPLVDKRIDRTGCEQWLSDRGWDPVKSACIGCPFHNNAKWADMKANQSQDFADAVQFETQVQLRQSEGNNTIRGIPYIHRSGQPLDTIDFGPAVLDDSAEPDGCGVLCAADDIEGAA
jgi:hypothetical protein